MHWAWAVREAKSRLGVGGESKDLFRALQGVMQTRLARLIDATLHVTASNVHLRASPFSTDVAYRGGTVIVCNDGNYLLPLRWIAVILQINIEEHRVLRARFTLIKARGVL